MDLHDAAGATSAVGVVRGAGVVPGVGLADLQGESCYNVLARHLNLHLNSLKTF